MKKFILATLFCYLLVNTVFCPNIFSEDSIFLQSKNELDIKIKPYFKVKEIKQIFNVNMRRINIMPLAITFTNNGKYAWQVSKFYAGKPNIALITSKEAVISPISSCNVSKRISGHTFAYYAGVFVLGGFVTAMVSTLGAGNVDRVNKKRLKEFDSIELKNCIVRPGDMAVGFIYFELNKDVYSLDKYKISVTLVDTDNIKKEDFIFNLKGERRKTANMLRKEMREKRKK